jgi:DNA-binding XRE family transcriptional regulator
MKTKVKVKLTGQIDLKDYENAHRDLECKGQFKLEIIHNPLVPVGALGPLRVPAVLMAVCKKCGSAYLVPGFRHSLELAIATQLVLSHEMLSKSQIKFLRQHFDLTQEELALKIGIPDRHTFSKMESESSPRTMSLETQIIMKLLFANMLGIKDSAKLYSLIEGRDDSRVASIEASALPSEEDVKALLKAS